MLAKVYLTYKTLEDSQDDDVILWIDSDINDIREEGIENLFNLAIILKGELLVSIMSFG